LALHFLRKKVASSFSAHIAQLFLGIGQVSYKSWPSTSLTSYTEPMLTVSDAELELVYLLPQILQLPLFGSDLLVALRRLLLRIGIRTLLLDVNMLRKGSRAVHIQVFAWVQLSTMLVCPSRLRRPAAVQRWW
jgi:hypothetical protein